MGAEALSSMWRRGRRAPGSDQARQRSFWKIAALLSRQNWEEVDDDQIGVTTPPSPHLVPPLTLGPLQQEFTVS